MAGKKRIANDYLAESEYWDSLSLDQILSEAEPVDIEVVDRRRRKAISIRMDEDVIAETKRIADKLRIGYQTIFRMWIREGLRRQNARIQEAKSRKRKRAA